SMGVFTAPLYPAAGRVVAHWISIRRRALANGLVTGSAMLGIASAYPLFARLIDAVGWRWAFAVTGTCTAALAALWAWYGREDPATHPRVNRAERELIAVGVPETVRDAGRPDGMAPTSSAGRAVLRNRSLWLLTASYAAVGYVEYLVFYWSEYY